MSTLEEIENLSTRSTTVAEFARYVIVGLASNIIAYIAYLLLKAAGVAYVLAMTLAYCFVLIFTFSANRKWTFRGATGVDKRFVVRFLQCYGLAYLVNAGMLMILVAHYGVSHQIAQGCLIILIAIGLYHAQRKWVFVSE